MTTYSDFYSALSDLSIDGVNNLAYPPASLNDADLPALWVQSPAGNEAVVAFKGGEWWPELRAQVVVVLSPITHDLRASAYQQMLEMLDALAAALHVSNVCKSPLSFSIRTSVVTVAGVDFWAVFADVEGKG